MGESKEFCGGTHVARTGDIGFFKITEEAGVAQGVRRIEAVTGAGALGYVRRLEGELGETGKLLRAGSVRGRRARRQAAGRAARAAEGDREAAAQAGLGRRPRSRRPRRATSAASACSPRAPTWPTPKALREVADQLRDKLGSGVIVLAGVEGDKIALVAMVTPDLGRQAQRRQDRRRGREGGRRQGRRAPRHGAGRRLRAAEPRRGAGPRVRPRPWLTRATLRDRRGRTAGATVAAAAAPPASSAILTASSWAQVRRLCTTGKVFVDDERALDPARRLRAGQTRRDRRRGAAARPDAPRLPHRLRRRPPGGDRQAVRDLQRPLRPQGDRDRDGHDPRRLASQGQARDRDAALRRAPHRQGHVGPALLREDAPGRARAAPASFNATPRAASTWRWRRARSARCASSRT